ncbi:Chlorovirus glycoprotein repeat domain-containing protein [Paramecium bursaria Chlorella virus CVB-1]|nr:Chlorovirus glycoprotein repeat domain-containing protein [Paramecium bursaria Chlorella virus CVB-1]
MSYNNFKYNMQKYAHIEPDTRNLIVPGNLYVDGSANIPGLQPADIAPISSTDIIGNILSGVYVSVSGNVKAQNLIGNGSFLENLTVEVPGNISADVLGNITGPSIILISNVVTATLVGNASRLAGVIVGFPSTGIADIRGNVYAPGNVNAANVSANSLIVYGNTFANVASVTGNVNANYFSGNGFFLTDVTQTFPSAAAIDIVGNVSAPGDIDTLLLTAGNIVASNAITNSMIITGNISALYFSGNGLNVSGVIPKTLNTEIFGNVFAAGNVSAQYLIGNGMAVTLGGYTIVPRGTVANQTARLALSNALPGSIVFQTDANVTYMLLGTPASSTSNWLQFTGANFPVTSVMGRTGNVLLLSNVDIKTIGGANIAAPGSLTSANINVIGNVTGQFVAANVIVSGKVTTNVLRANTLIVTGNVIANYLVGNGMLLEAVQLTIPLTANIDITGNVLAPANVDTHSIITTVVRAGNVSVNGQVNIVGNVYAAFFVGNGSTMIGIPPSGTQPIGIIGNVSAPGNVNASNVTTDNIRIGNVITLGQVNVLGNVVTDGFFTGSGSRLTNVPAIVSGTQVMNISGNVAASGNVDASNVLTSILRAPNVIVTGQVNSSGGGNVSSLGFFIGSGTQLTGVTATLGGTQSLDIIGNVVASGNVDASNVSTRLLRVTGNVNVRGQVNVTGNVVALNFFGSGSGLTGVSATATGNQSINIVGNVVASANVDASNVSANILRVLGNIVVGGQVNVIGNVTSNRLIGNGIFLQGIIATGNLNVDIFGNVNASGNVNTQNVVTLLLRASNCVVSGQTNVTGNVVAGSFVGDGSQLQGIILGAGGSPLPSFVPPSTGFTSNVANTILYSNTVGWTIHLTVYVDNFITINTYSMPVNPDAPFVNLPDGVNQTMITPFSFSSGVWSATCKLTTTSLFDSRPVSMGYNSSIGVLAGNSSATEGIGIRIVSKTGAFRAFFNTPDWETDVWMHPTTQNIWGMYNPINTQTVMGVTFVPGQLYLLEFTTNFEYLVSWHAVTSGSTVQYPTSSASCVIRFSSETEAYLCFQPITIGQGATVYDKMITSPVVKSTGYYFMARINPTARTCQWITTVSCPSATSSQRPVVSLNPQKDIMLFYSTFVGNGVSDVLNVGNLSGTVNSMLLPAGVTWHSPGFGLHPSNGIYISNTLFATHGSAGTVTPQAPAVNTDRWHPNGQVTYMFTNTFAASQYNLSTWNSAGNTWTLQTALIPQQTTYNGVTPQPFLYRLPLGNVSSPWTSQAITVSPFTPQPQNDNLRYAYAVNVVPTGDGNVMLIATCSGNTIPAMTYTFGSASVSTPANFTSEPIIVFKFQDTNGSFTNFGGIVSSSSDSFKFLGYPLFLTYSACKVPGSNNSIRVIGTTNNTNATLGGVSCTNLSGAGIMYPFTVDITSALAVSNFRAQNTNVPAALQVTDFISTSVAFGPNNSPNMVGWRHLGIIKT